jgi:hypothetical protein
MSQVSLQGKRIVFCLPGYHYSGRFMINMLFLHDYLRNQGAIIKYEQHTRAGLHAARRACLRPVERKPFGGEPYDYMMWIDSDVVFGPENFTKLVNHDKDIISGWHASPYADMIATPVWEGLTFLFEHTVPIDVMESRTEPFKATAAGLGWCLIKQGVVEKMVWPWFGHKMVKIDGVQIDPGEDIIFFLEAAGAGFQLWVDPTCRVGHEKTVVL